MIRLLIKPVCIRSWSFLLDNCATAGGLAISVPRRNIGLNCSARAAEENPVGHFLINWKKSASNDRSLPATICSGMPASNEMAIAFPFRVIDKAIMAFEHTVGAKSAIGNNSRISLAQWLLYCPGLEPGRPRQSACLDQRGSHCFLSRYDTLNGG
jgi:hypothetical protein